MCYVPPELAKRERKPLNTQYIKMHFSSQTIQINNICFVCLYVIFKFNFRVDDVELCQYLMAA